MSYGTGERVLVPGQVLMADLVKPGTKTLFITGGTVLTPEIIGKIRQAGLEPQALNCVRDFHGAAGSGIELKWHRRSSVEDARQQTKRLAEAASGLRNILYMVLVVSGALAAITRSEAFVALAILVFLALILVGMGTMNFWDSRKGQLHELGVQEQQLQAQAQELLNQAALGDEAAIGEVLVNGVVSQERVFSMAVGRGTVTVNALLPDTKKLLAGKPVQPRPADISPERARSLRTATPAEVDKIIRTAGEIVTGTFELSPTTHRMALSVMDAFEDRETGALYIGCIARQVINKVMYEDIVKHQQAGDQAMALARLTAFRMDFAHNGTFREVPIAALSEDGTVG